MHKCIILGIVLGLLVATFLSRTNALRMQEEITAIKKSLNYGLARRVNYDELLEAMDNVSFELGREGE